MSYLVIFGIIGVFIYSLMKDTKHTSSRNKILKENNKFIDESIKRHKQVYGDFNKK